MNGEGRKRREAMVIDTSIFVDLLRGEEKAARYILKFEGELRVSRLTIMELIRGVKTKVELDKLFKQLEDFGKIVIIETDEEISLKAGEIFRDLWLAEGIGIIDSFIASTAMVNGEELITRNAKHFKRIDGLDLIVPY